VPLTREHWRQLRADEQFDAVLYLGPPPASEADPLSKALCTEPGYLQLRRTRIALAGLPPPETERIQALCGDSPR
jgi:hypothetical protein